MPSNVILRNGVERAKYGCTTTWKNASGELLTVHRGGSPKVAVIDIARDVLALDETYRLVCYSTPETIYRDVAMADARLNTKARTPESAVLSMAGLSHLLHPDAPANIETHIRKGRK